MTNIKIKEYNKQMDIVKEHEFVGIKEGNIIRYIDDNNYKKTVNIKDNIIIADGNSSFSRLDLKNCFLTINLKDTNQVIKEKIEEVKIDNDGYFYAVSYKFANGKYMYKIEYGEEI